MTETAPRSQITLLRDVLELARSQSDALERDDLDAFELAQARRETLLAGVDADAADVDGESTDLAALADQILEQDRANAAALAALMTSIRGEIPALARGHQANAAYRVMERSSAFINRVS